MPNKAINIILFMYTLYFLNNYKVFANDFIYYRGEKKEIHKVDTKKYILLKSKIDTNNPGKSIALFSDKLIDHGTIYLNLNLNTIVPPKEKIKEWIVIQTEDKEAQPIKDNEEVLYESSFYCTNDGDTIGVSHLFYVKLKSEKDIDKLKQIAVDNNIKILGNNKYMPLWFVLACDKNSKGNALEMANLFNEEQEFDMVKPDYLLEYTP